MWILFQKAANFIAEVNANLKGKIRQIVYKQTLNPSLKVWIKDNER